MAGMNKIESYLMDLDIAYQEVSPSAFFVEDATKGLPGISITLSEPIVLMRAFVMKAPKSQRADLFEKLLRLNGTDMVHGAYGLDAEDVVLIDTLEYDTMDKAEFEAALDSIGLALSRHYGTLGAFRN